MKFIYILEDDERIKKDLFDTLQNIDPRLYIRFFPSLEHFHNWLKLAIREGPIALAKGGNKHQDDLSENPPPSPSHELRLVIANNEFMGTKNMNLVERAREFFIRKKMCSEQEATALILTAFDSPDFDISLAEKRIINNVLFKPFDKLILKQHLEYALKGHNPVNSGTIATMNIQSTIEMLKDVPPPVLSEIGFTTLNDAAIELGSFAKYYSESFKAENKRSTFAYCKSCEQISEKEFLCEFRFFGIDNKQISQIRKNILQNNSHETKDLKNTHGKPMRVLILDEDQTTGMDLKHFLTEKISNLEVFYYSSYSQLLADLSDKDTVHKQQLPDAIDIIFADYEIFEVEKNKRWEQICDNLQIRSKKLSAISNAIPDLHLISKKDLQMDTIKELSTWVKNVLFFPLDKNYLSKTIFSQYSTLLNKNKLTIGSIRDTNPIKAANPVQISQISEAGLVLKYYRALSIGSFREFILWRPQELDTPEIIGTVNFTEEGEDQDDFFMNHFIFFGMKDLFLKHIRLWLREAYIKGKDQS